MIYEWEGYIEWGGESLAKEEGGKETKDSRGEKKQVFNKEKE